MSRSWVDIGSDVNWREHGGLWARHVEGTRYHVLRFINRGDYGQAGYTCYLCETDLTDPRLDAARQCSGYATDWCDDYGDPLPVWSKVEALAGYGAFDIVHDDTGPNAHKLVRAAKRFSR